MIGSEQVATGTAELIVEQIKLRKVKGQTGKPLRAFRLHTVVGGVDVDGQVFVKVTGDGVVGKVEPASNPPSDRLVSNLSPA